MLCVLYRQLNTVSLPFVKYVKVFYFQQDPKFLERKHFLLLISVYLPSTWHSLEKKQKNIDIDHCNILFIYLTNIHGALTICLSTVSGTGDATVNKKCSCGIYD